MGCPQGKLLYIKLLRRLKCYMKTPFLEDYSRFSWYGNWSLWSRGSKHCLFESSMSLIKMNLWQCRQVAVLSVWKYTEILLEGLTCYTQYLSLRSDLRGGKKIIEIPPSPASRGVNERISKARHEWLRDGVAELWVTQVGKKWGVGSEALWALAAELQTLFASHWEDCCALCILCVWCNLCKHDQLEICPKR